MTLKISGTTIGNVSGGPSSLTLADLADVSISSPTSNQYLMYNGLISEWQNVDLGPGVFDYLDVNLIANDGITLTTIAGPNTIELGLGNITPTSVVATGTILGSNISGTNTGDQTITLTGDVTGTGTGSFPTTLATVNSSPQSDTFRKITVNGKGLVTATSAVTSSDITTSLGYTPVNRAGDTMAGDLILNADPTVALGAATKQYVDNFTSGLNIHASCRAATLSDLTATYNNGAGGVGATLTGVGALPTIDGVTLSLNDRVLVKDQSNQIQNGIYVVTQITANWILTRATDFDDSPNGEVVAGDATYVQEGTQASTQWVQTTSGDITIGTSNIVFSQFGGPGSYTGGTGIDVTGTVISLATSNVLSLYNLGTNGLVVRTGSNTVTSRNIAVSGNGISIADGDGVSGNPTVSVNSTNLNTPSTIVYRDGFGNFNANIITAGLVGNASTASSLQISRTISATGDATWTVNFDGSANVSSALTLATVNSSPQTDTFRKITVNGKGLVTATSAVTASDITPLIDGTYVNITGDTMTGPLIVDVNTSSDALRITQIGSGNALVVEDSANPDASPFVIDSTGKTIIGTPTASANTALLQVSSNGFFSQGIKVGSFADGTESGGLINQGNTSKSIRVEADPANVGANSSILFHVDGSIVGQFSHFGTFVAGSSSGASTIRLRSTMDVTDLVSTTNNGVFEGTHTLTANNAIGYAGVSSQTDINQNGFNQTSSSAGGGTMGFRTLMQTTGASGTVTLSTGYYSDIRNTGAGTLTTARGFMSTFANSGGGTLTNTQGFYAENVSAGTNNYGFYGNLAAGANKWNFYAAGTAVNYFAGNVGIGAGKTAPATALDVNGTVTATTFEGNSTTQAAKTSNATLATTAFVDRLRSLLSSTTTGTAVISDRGCLVPITAGFTIPASVFSANDTFTLYNDTAGNLTITQGGGLTMYLVGTATTGNRTLAQRGLATVLFITPTVAVISGGGLT